VYCLPDYLASLGNRRRWGRVRSNPIPERPGSDAVFSGELLLRQLRRMPGTGDGDPLARVKLSLGHASKITSATYTSSPATRQIALTSSQATQSPSDRRHDGAFPQLRQGSGCGLGNIFKNSSFVMPNCLASSSRAKFRPPGVGTRAATGARLFAWKDGDS